MEHNLLNDFSLVARENVVQTYLALAQSLPETKIDKRPDYTRVKGKWPLSFCHFAADFNTRRRAEDLAKELRAESNNTDGLWVFLLPGDEPDGLHTHLLDEGFSLRQCLCQFGRQAKGSWVEDLQEAQDADTRLRIGKFMAEQFFPFSSGESRMLVARSTALSIANLFYIGSPERPEAAMMLSKSKNAVGLYNLCVDGKSRGHGIGTDLVESAQALASQYGVPLTLQCHASLRKWYENQNFRQTGTLHAFFRGLSSKTDIL
ncbi:MAG: GNAT family N-acetyltransferase [Fimbriimonadaceae bacterium]